MNRRQISISMSGEEIAALDERAKSFRLSRSALAGMIIRDFLDEWGVLEKRANATGESRRIRRTLDPIVGHSGMEDA